jgi:NAD(P)-dependent dehydrogenase (short-subunit alcohol dehydrogenase family)
MAEKVAIITGASRGIGRGIALALGELKWNVVVNYASNADAAQEVVAAIAEKGGKGLAVRGDVSIAADRERLVDETLANFARVDLLVNNAGVAPNVRADILEATEESFERLININLKGPYFLTQRVAKEMIREKAKNQKPGSTYAPSIVTISSISAYTASVNRGDYCIAKSGLAMMTSLYATRLAEYGINVYEIRPGIIETDMTGAVKAKYDKLFAEGLTRIHGWGRPEEVAKAVTSIAQNLLPFSTGEIINVDGGFHLRRL